MQNLLVDYLPLVLFIGLLGLITKPIGLYLAQVLDPAGKTWLDPLVRPVERFAYRLMGVLCPAPLDAVLRRRIERVALKAYQALRLRDYGRVDLRVRNGVPYVLDVNANPDITMEGGFARSARVAGYDYGRMSAQILAFAAERRPA